MRPTQKFLFSLTFFSTTLFFLFACSGTNEKNPRAVFWFSSDSMIAGENYHHDSIDSLVATTYLDKSRKRKKQFEVQKEISNRRIYDYTLEFDSAGRKRTENLFVMKTSNSVSRFFDKSGNIFHESINFFNENSGGENLMVDFDNHMISSIFISGEDFYQKQEYDSLGRIKNLSKPYRAEGETVDSTRFILFNTEKQKSEFKDTLMEQVKKLEGELQSPMNAK